MLGWIVLGGLIIWLTGLTVKLALITEELREFKEKYREENKFLGETAAKCWWHDGAQHVHIKDVMKAYFAVKEVDVSVHWRGTLPPYEVRITDKD